ncbi:acyl-CoA dehydrogenase family protein [Nocardia xishanensis]|uniref:acyl-CoA dehydrogenase family protein n=1 Tax=Nocardia xishanensis TaxID=238964 RepID=UPI00082A1260|nr:acyl-CoA dehydrogenase family protein [Nocardia xishanensis]
MDFSFTDEQRSIAETFDRFCDKELNYDYVRWMDENVDFPPDELWDKFADLGLFAAAVPVEYGGQGLGSVDTMIAYEQICKRSMSVALAVGTVIGFGARFLTELGTDEQKQRYLPRLAQGRLRTSMALTESGGGTDILGSLSTFAEDAGDSWVINGSKIFITGAHAADLIFTVCRTERDTRRRESWSTIIVPRRTEGLTMRPVEKISCHHCDSMEITFDNVVVPKDNLIGTRGQAYREIMTVLNPERIGVAMLGVGAIAAIYDYCMRYVQERHAFGGPIGRFQSLQHYLADMRIHLENARNLTYKAAWLCDTGQPYHLEATMAKLVAAEGARHAGTYGTEIFGGYGICNEYPVSMFARDSYQIQFSPISNEMSRNMLMQFQGLPKSWA